MRGLYHSVSSHVHRMEDLSRRCSHCREHMLLTSVCGISLRPRVPTKCQPHLHLPPSVLFLYIFSKYMYIFSTQNIELLFCDISKEDSKKRSH